MQSIAAMVPLGHQRHNLRCTISEETKVKLLRLAEVLGVDGPFSRLDELIEAAVNIAVKAKDPALKKRREPERS